MIIYALLFDNSVIDVFLKEQDAVETLHNMKNSKEWSIYRINVATLEITKISVN